MNDKKIIYEISQLMLDKKALDIKIINVIGLTSLTDYFINCSSQSDPQTRAIKNYIEEKLLDNPQLMKEGEIVTVITNSENRLPISLEMPANVVLEVISTEPGVKGNTATNATKPATLETGAVVNVPLFINEGDKIKVETEKGTYKERIKE